MTEDHTPIEDLAGYALGSLERSEALAVERHLQRCPACARRVEEYRATAHALPIALPPVTPPREAWAEITTAIRAEAGRRHSPSPARIIARRLSVARWPAVAALVGLLVFQNVTLERELARRAPGPSPGPEVEALSRRPGRIVILTGTRGPQPAGRIFVAVDGGGHLAVSGLGALPTARVYQLWFLETGGAASSGATFRVDGTGRAWVKVAVPPSLDQLREIGVTEEPAPGSSAPTGDYVLLARSWR